MSINFSQLSFPELTAKDQKIIKDNEGADIAMLRSLGLSEKGIKHLEQFEAGVKPYEPKNLQPTRVEHTPIQRPVQNNRNNGETMRVYNSRTGNTVTMKRSKAEKLLTKQNPDRLSRHQPGRAYRQA